MCSSWVLEMSVGAIQGVGLRVTEIEGARWG